MTDTEMPVAVCERCGGELKERMSYTPSVCDYEEEEYCPQCEETNER
jgi:hypothetical protein